MLHSVVPLPFDVLADQIPLMFTNQDAVLPHFNAFSQGPVGARMETNSFVVMASRSAEYSEFVKKEIERWTQVIQTAGIKPE